MDVITHVSDLEAFREEAKILAGAVDDEGSKLIPDLFYDPEADELIYGVTKIPVHYSTPESVTLIRAEDASDLDHFLHFHKLGECINNEYVFDSEDARLTYERVRGPLEVTYVDETGETVTYRRPYMIGVFA